MNKERVLILDKERIGRKLKRMAYQIWERNSRERELMLIGIEHGGVAVANGLARALREISPLRVQVLPFRINKKDPLQDLPRVSENLDGRSVVLVDDVANSGRTLLYALRSLLEYLPASISVAVLVDRTHKRFPITPDIVGYNVSTTLQEHIEVELEGDEIKAAYLQ
jgi:pyrimidine operon attenuation protein/uracil phosphoribosyltransferase